MTTKTVVTGELEPAATQPKKKDTAIAKLPANLSFTPTTRIS